MKPIYFFLFTLWSVSVLSQEPYEEMLPVNESGLIEYTEVVELNGTADDLYSAAREWFSKSYNSAEDVLQMDDRQSGKLIGRAFQQIYSSTLGEKLYYTISVFVKDGRYKYSITELGIQSYPNSTYPNPQLFPIEYLVITNLYKPNGKVKKYPAAAKVAMMKSIESLISNLKESMSQSVQSDSEDDW